MRLLFRTIIVVFVIISLFIQCISFSYSSLSFEEDKEVCSSDIVEIGELVVIDFLSNLKRIVEVSCIVNNLIDNKKPTKDKEKSQNRPSVPINHDKNIDFAYIFFIFLNWFSVVSIFLGQVLLLVSFLSLLKEKKKFFILFLILLITPLLFGRFCCYTPRSSIGETVIIFNFGCV